MSRHIEKLTIGFGFSLIITIIIFNLYISYPDFSNSPEHFTGDSILNIAFIKNILESGNIYTFNNLGAPFDSNIYDFPGSDDAYILIIKFLTIFIREPTSVLIAFVILSSLLTFISSYIVFKNFKISKALSLAGAFIFTFAPYHFLRGANHLYLAAYFSIPIIVYFCKKIYENKDKTTKSDYILLMICGSSGIYYAFFGIIYIILSGIISSFNKKDKQPLALSIKLVAIIILVSLANLVPNYVYQIKEGNNLGIAKRSVIESDLYGLRVSELLLLPPEYGSHGKTKEYYDNRTATESRSSSLGLITSVGFIILLIVTIFPEKLKKTDNYPYILLFSKLNIFSILFATVGGGGVLFSILATPQFRGLNRISIFIAFISLLTLLIIVHNIVTKQKISDVSILILSLLFVLLAFINQIPNGYTATRKEYSPLKDFIFEIENHANNKHKNNSLMIYQMPYLKYPESSPLYEEGYNGLMLPYLVSSNIKWSYGKIKGRIGDIWESEISKYSLPEKIQALRSVNFNGIFIHRKAYTDHASALEEEISKNLKQYPLVSTDLNYSFFFLPPASNNLAPTNPNPLITYSFGRGFYELEKDEKENKQWAWLKGKANISIYNFTKEEVNAKLDFNISSLDERDFHIYFGNQEFFNDNLLPGISHHIALPIRTKPGKQDIIIYSNNSDINISTDPRNLSLKIDSLKVEAVP